MRKKIVGGLLAISALFSLGAGRVNAWELEDWTSADGYGTVTKVDDNITNIKGETQVNEGMFYGAYTNKSTQKLDDGIKEELYIELNKDDYAVGEFFEVTVALKNSTDDDSNLREIIMQAQRTADGFLISSNVADPDFKVNITEDGVYTFTWNMYKVEDKAYAQLQISRWDEILGTSIEIDLDNEAFSNEAVLKPLSEHEGVTTRYVWFCNVQVANGINVYTTLPEKPIIDEEQPQAPVDEKDETIAENPNTSDNIVWYASVAVLGLVIVAIAAKKVFVK